VLFCGMTDHFEMGCTLTAELFAKHHPAIQIDCVRCTAADVATQIVDAHVALPLLCQFDEGVIASAKNLRLVMQYGTGLNNVDIPACSARGIHVSRIPAEDSGNAEATADHALYLMLALFRRPRLLAETFRRGALGGPQVALQAKGKRVLLVGFGSIGQAVHARLRPFGCVVSAVRASGWTAAQRAAAPDLADCGTAPRDTLRMCAEADVVILVCALTASNAGMVGREFVASLRPGALLVNVARGGLCEYQPLLDGLNSGQVGGFATDVGNSTRDGSWDGSAPPEPFPPDDPLALHPAALFTAHRRVCRCVLPTDGAGRGRCVSAGARRLRASCAGVRVTV
jgi:phosphoglycerate dehydrogenase-like enzyme